MPSTYIIYYVETNLICLVFIGFVFYTYLRESKGLTESKWFLAALVTVQIYCIVDIFAALFKNQVFIGARTILWASNAIYIAIPLVLVIFWNQYIREHVRSYYQAGKAFERIDALMNVASIVMCVVALSTPFTHSTFYLDDQNSYHRALGAYLVPLFAYLFMVYVTVKLQVIRRKSESLQVKQDANILSLFALPCIVFSMVQVLIYGTTVSQVGFTMAMMIIYLARQRNKISHDELTGLNNRREYEYAIDRLSRTQGTAMILMIDVDDFKSINDTYGHIEGDNALKGVAAILRSACANHKDLGGIALYRYGGDEFIMVSTEANIEETKELWVKAIQDETEKWNSRSAKPYKLESSTGFSCGGFTGKGIYDLIKSADETMYEVKAARKQRMRGAEA